MSTNLGNGEVQLWSFVADTKGFFRIKVIISLVVTNFRIMRIDKEDNKVLGYILFPQIDDVVVMNTQRVSQSTGYGISTGSYVRTGQRFSSGTSKTIGDIVFIVNGQKISWGGIPDPTGLKNFIKSIKRTMYDPLTKLETKSSRSVEVEFLVLAAVYKIQKTQNSVTIAEKFSHQFARNVEMSNPIRCIILQ